MVLNDARDVINGTQHTHEKQFIYSQQLISLLETKVLTFLKGVNIPYKVLNVIVNNLDSCMHTYQWAMHLLLQKAIKPRMEWNGINRGPRQF